MFNDEENSDGLTAKERDQIASLIQDLEEFEARMAARPARNPKAVLVPLGPDSKTVARLQLTRRTR